MKNLFILFISILFIGCQQQSSNIDTGDWSGTMSENDENFCDFCGCDPCDCDWGQE